MGFRHGWIRPLARGSQEPACLSALPPRPVAALSDSHMVARTSRLSSCGKSLFLCSLGKVLRLGLDGPSLAHVPATDRTTAASCRHWLRLEPAKMSPRPGVCISDTQPCPWPGPNWSLGQAWEQAQFPGGGAGGGGGDRMRMRRSGGRAQPWRPQLTPGPCHPQAPAAEAGAGAPRPQRPRPQLPSRDGCPAPQVQAGPPPRERPGAA